MYPAAEASVARKAVIFRYDRVKVGCRVCGGTVDGGPSEKQRCITCRGKGWHKGVGGANWHREEFWYRFSEFVYG
jgi:DnaJ-class molecular chaperone